jgi:hypothetical protein
VNVKILFSAARLIAASGAAEAQDSRHRILPAFGLHLLNIDVAAANAGLVYRPFDAEEPFWTVRAMVEGGVAGGGVNLGLGRSWPPDTDWGGPGSEFSLRFQGAFLRTWGNPFRVDGNRSLLGAEVQAMATVFGVRLGVFRTVDALPPETVFSAGLVLGWQ